MRRRFLAVAILLATAGAFALVALRMSHHALAAAASPRWPYLIVSFVIACAVQPLRALAWRTTLRAPVEFRALFAASAIGSFLDTVLPGRLGEASKVGVLRVASGPRWPGLPRAAGSLLAAHLLEAIAFAVIGAASAFFLPFPTWARGALVGGLALAAGGMIAATLLHRRIGHRLPRALNRFLAGAAAPPRVLAQAGCVLLVTWLVRWFGVMFLLNAVGVRAGLDVALVYMVVTGLANTAPLLPGNAGLYQGAAIGALALVGHAGEQAIAVSLLAPVFASIVTGTAALVGMALYGRRFLELPRAAFARA